MTFRSEIVGNWFTWGLVDGGFFLLERRFDKRAFIWDDDCESKVLDFRILLCKNSHLMMILA